MAEIRVDSFSSEQRHWFAVRANRAVWAGPREGDFGSGEYAGWRGLTRGHRNGAVRKRSQSEVEIDGEKHFTKRDKTTGEFMAQKDDEKFKGVRKE